MCLYPAGAVKVFLVVRFMVDGLILAGGESRRMGVDKAGLPVNGKTLLQHQLAMMQPQVQQLFVAGGQHGGQSLPAGVRRLDDVYAGNQGPLSGILAALQASTAQFLWIMSCDCFGFDATLLAALEQKISKTGADIAYLHHRGRDYPLLALWHTGLRQQLWQYMQAGGRSVFGFYAGLAVQPVDMPASPAQFCNINTPDDYQALVKALC